MLFLILKAIQIVVCLINEINFFVFKKLFVLEREKVAKDEKMSSLPKLFTLGNEDKLLLFYKSKK